MTSVTVSVSVTVFQLVFVTRHTIHTNFCYLNSSSKLPLN